MLKHSIQMLGLAAVLAVPTFSSAQNTVNIPFDAEQLIQGGSESYAVSLEGIGFDIKEIKSNQSVTVRVTKDKWDDNVYTYSGKYAQLAYDEEGRTFLDGNYIKSPAMNMSVSDDNKQLVFSWDNITNTDWQTDVTQSWLPWIPEMQSGYLRLTIPEGIVTITATDGKEYINAASTIYYEIIGTSTVVPISKVTPAPGNVTSLSEIQFRFDFGTNMGKAVKYSDDFLSSDVSFTFTPAGSDKAQKIYDLKKFSFDAASGTVNLSFTKNGEPATYTEPGTYTISAPTRQFAFEDANGTELGISRSFTYSWTVEKPVAHYTAFQPNEGNLNLDIQDQGIASVLFNFREGKGEPNKEADLYAQLYRDGELIAQVPSNNYKLITYDGFYAFIWCISFWENPDGRAKLPGDYTVVLPEGLFLVDGLPSQEKIAHYSIKGSPYTAIPAKGEVSQFQTVIITCPEADGLEIDLSDPEKQPFLYSLQGSEDDNTEFDLMIDGNSIVITTKEPVTAPGKWEIGVPKEILTLVYGTGDAAVKMPAAEDASVSYIIPNADKYRPELQLASAVEFLPGTIEMKMPEGVTAAMVNSVQPTYIYPVDEDGNILGEYSARYSAWKTNNGASFELRNIIGANANLYLAPGRYALVLGDKLFNTTGDNTFSAPMTYYFYVKNEKLPYTTNPYDGKYLTSLSSVEFTFNKPVKVANVQPAMISDGVTTYCMEGSVKSDDNKTIVYSGRVMDVNGKYVLRAPAAAIQATEKNEDGTVDVYDVRYNFTIIDEGDQVYLPRPAVVPASGEVNADDLLAITLTYAEAGKVTDQFDAQLKDVASPNTRSESVSYLATVDGNVVSLKAPLYTEITEGNYYLVLPQGYYFTDEAISEACVIYYSVTSAGVGSVNVDFDGRYTVFTIDGICLMRNADAEALSTLKSGLYIINGQKIMLRK